MDALAKKDFYKQSVVCCKSLEEIQERLNKGQTQKRSEMQTFKTRELAE